MQLFEQKLQISFYFSFNKFRKLVKFCFFISDTGQNFMNYEKTRAFGVLCCQG